MLLRQAYRFSWTLPVSRALQLKMEERWGRICIAANDQLFYTR
ncbi:hypothetical protein NBRC111894_2233 [Sporolactobacillus inulinus]|uniref:Uncharacterized protein n=1 Tax=Sporolactobacillus inulinus TaxID=2078 RepID=A0A4Y1ZCD7_9BACL|nr:hypothetical protein NBRC111894_2233 [Sporolactobacillus inulinus]